MSTRRKCQSRLPNQNTANSFHRYNFGDNLARNENGTGSYMQLLSVTDQDRAWNDFHLTRIAALKQLPPIVDPVVLQKVPKVLDSITQTLGISEPTDKSASNDKTPEAGAAGAVAAVSSPSASPTATSVSTHDAVVSLLDKYGPVVIGLLAGSILVMLLLCILALAMCIRRPKTRSVSSSYAPVRYKDKAADDSESSVPIHSYED